jgi:predicted nucleic-acid-binding Zn-ribbon protein
MGMSRKRKIFDSTENEPGPHSFRVRGKNIICPHCGNKKFEMESKLLNTSGMTFFKLDWANRQATILTCTKCSNIQWFLKQPEVVK